jgi:simple sugar transport system ATP-binding protein
VLHPTPESAISIANRSPKEIRRLGVGYIPEDRRERGLILSYSVADNLIFGVEDKPPFSHVGVLDFGQIMANARKLIPRYDIRPRRADVPVGTLSGGNQQKVVLAREFSEEPRLLIASQPTRGLDIGAIEFVHKGLVEKRDQGVAVLLVSAELDEIMELSDRIAVLYEGQIMGIFKAGAVDEDRLGLLMTGGEARSAEQAIDLSAPALEGE